jgi:hypothetical protein
MLVRMQGAPHADAIDALRSYTSPLDVERLTYRYDDSSSSSSHAAPARSPRRPRRVIVPFANGVDALEAATKVPAAVA